MIPTAPAALMTAEEFYEWAWLPENAGRMWELEDGVPVEVGGLDMPPPGEPHGLVIWFIVTRLTDYIRRRGGGHLFANDTGLVVRRRPDTVRGPDIMLFLDSLELAQAKRGPVDRVPALVVEVMSPSDTHRRTTRRVGQYIKRGVPLIWVVEPEAQVVYVHKPDEFTNVLEGDEELTGNSVLPDFACKAADLFVLPPAA